MLMGPALSIFYVDTLQLNHEEISNARFLFMTIGVILSSFLWRKSLEKMSLNQIMPLITIGFGLFPLLILAAYLSPIYLNLAFLMYGIAQAGSHLIWHLSGTIFSQDKNSTPFTSVNILLQGLRGMVAPLLGGVLCTFFGPVHVLILGSLLCFWGVWIMLRYALKRPLRYFS
ncbi:MAG: hypothetical protein HYZ47_01405, partial [Simkania negevensis]|nr:hypothetical protein [Simkania negevensis]